MNNTAANNASIHNPAAIDLTEPDRVDEPEHVDVLVIGAGLSGIAAGYYLGTEAPGVSYAIVESRAAIGGTWDLFRYPGVRSDSDMYTLGYSFRPWEKKDAIGEGQDILDYIVDTARETGVDRHIRFRHRVVSADWLTDDAQWRVVVQRPMPGSEEVGAQGRPWHPTPTSSGPSSPVGPTWPPATSTG